MPYAMVSHYNQHNYYTIRFLEAAYKAGYKELADRVSKALHKDFDQQIKYIGSLSDKNQENMHIELQSAQQYLQMLNMMEAQYKGSSLTNNPEFQNIISNSPDTSPKAVDSGKK
jgi:hypothetical protein